MSQWICSRSCSPYDVRLLARKNEEPEFTAREFAIGVLKHFFLRFLYRSRKICSLLNADSISVSGLTRERKLKLDQSGCIRRIPINRADHFSTSFPHIDWNSLQIIIAPEDPRKIHLVCTHLMLEFSVFFRDPLCYQLKWYREWPCNRSSTNRATSVRQSSSFFYPLRSTPPRTRPDCKPNRKPPSREDEERRWKKGTRKNSIFRRDDNGKESSCRWKVTF